ncbi:MAG: cadherin-like domain-containing protein [Anaerolineae bacterium]
MKRIYLNAKFHRVILIVTIISLSLLFLISLKPVFAADPIAVDDAYTTPEDIEKLIDAPGVAANDSGDVGTLTVLLDSNPLVGNLTLDKTGAFTYTPPLNYNGLVTFTYHLTDALGTSSPAVVTITVTAVNDPPTALDDSNTTAEDTAVATDVLANDSDVEGPLDATSLAVVTAPSNGTTEVSPTNGVITYTPIANFNGNDSFVYQVYDNGSPLPALPVTATVNLLITAVNDAPIAGNDSGGTTDEATPINVSAPGVLANEATVTIPLHPPY